MAGGKKKISVIKLAEQRDSKLEQVSTLIKKIQKLEAEAEKLDDIIINTCNHPKRYLKIKAFTDGTPQNTVWICKLCFNQVVEQEDPNKYNDLIDQMYEEVFGELPPSISPPKGK